MPIEAVVFDWGGTLTPWHDIDPLEQWLAVVGDDEAAVRLHDAATAVWVRSRDEHRSATLEEVFGAAGIEHTGDVVAEFYRWWEPHTFTDPDAHGVFAGLREQGIRIGILSNTLWSRAEHERIFDRDGLSPLIDGAVYSSEIPWIKPHPEAFRAAVGVTAPERAAFVGDRPYDDIHGAASAGLRTILIPHSTIPADQHGSALGEPDAVAHRLGDVLDIVTRWHRDGPGG